MEQCVKYSEDWVFEKLLESHLKDTIQLKKQVGAEKGEIYNYVYSHANILQIKAVKDGDEYTGVFELVKKYYNRNSILVNYEQLERYITLKDAEYLKETVDYAMGRCRSEFGRALKYRVFDWNTDRYGEKTMVLEVPKPSHKWYRPNRQTVFVKFKLLNEKYEIIAYIVHEGKTQVVFTVTESSDVHRMLDDFVELVDEVYS